MKRALDYRTMTGLALALASAAVLAAGQPGEKPAPESGPAAAEDSETTTRDGASGAAGVRVYLDPETGELIERPADAEPPGGPWPLRERFSTKSRDLPQEALAGGGFKVDLRGRFQSAVVATIDPETEEVTIDCISSERSAQQAEESEASDER